MIPACAKKSVSFESVRQVCNYKPFVAHSVSLYLPLVLGWTPFDDNTRRLDTLSLKWMDQVQMNGRGFVRNFNYLYS